MKGWYLLGILLITAGLGGALPQISVKPSLKVQSATQRFLNPEGHVMKVANGTNSNTTESGNITHDLPIRVPHLFAAPNHEERMKDALAHGQASNDPPTTETVKKETAQLQAAWLEYTKNYNSVPMKQTCAAILQTTRSEFAAHHCSVEFLEGLELCERAEPYCKLFNQYFKTSVVAMEEQGDKWCSKGECEYSLEQLAACEQYCYGVGAQNPANLYPAVQKTVAAYYPGWKTAGCLGDICASLDKQAARVRAAYADFAELGPAYASYTNQYKLQSLVLYDMHEVILCA